MKVYVVIAAYHNSVIDFGISIKGIFSSEEKAREICTNLNRETKVYLKECNELRELPGITANYFINRYEVE